MLHTRLEPGAAPKTNLSPFSLSFSLSMSHAQTFVSPHLRDGIRPKLVKMTLECSLDLSTGDRNILLLLPRACVCLCERVPSMQVLRTHRECQAHKSSHACSIPEREKAPTAAFNCEQSRSGSNLIFQHTNK